MRTRMIYAPGSQLERVQHRFELWRETRERCLPIPEPLWVSRWNWLGSTAYTQPLELLRLNYYSLKKRLSFVAGATCSPQKEATFVELLPPGAVGVSACIIEMENAQGGKMKIHLQGLGTPDLSVLSNSFWKAAS